MNYGELQDAVTRFASGLIVLGLQRGERVAIYLEKRFETVIASFGAPAAGGVFVPLNPLLKAEQVGYILRDCNVRVLVTSPGAPGAAAGHPAALATTCAMSLFWIRTRSPASYRRAECLPLERLARHAAQPGHRVIDTDVVGILYTSGSTGKPKGVVLSHRNMVAGAKSVASYLENRPDDTLLAALPLSFDAGFSQLTTAFHVGARVVLLNYLLPRDVLKAIEREKVTGLTAVPPLYIQLTQLNWPEIDHRTSALLRQHRRPHAARDAGRTCAGICRRRSPILMYGLTEAFRSTYLPPAEVDRRPDSIGKAIPNAEILVLREDGSPCAPNEPGELVHRGALVGMGYWNDPEKTAERYKPLPVHAPGPRGRTGAAGNRRFLGRHGAHGRGRLPLFHRPPRRNDEDFGLPGQPDRG